MRKLDGREGDALLALARGAGVDVLRQGLIDAVSGGDRCTLRGGGGDEARERGGGEVSSDHRVSSWGPEALRPSEPDPEGRAGRAVSRVLFPALACPGWSSVWDGRRRPPLAAYPRLVLSVWVTPRRLFGLAPTGGYRATAVAGGAVGSYPTVSPLPDGRPVGRSVFCGPVRRLSAPRRYLAVYPVELGLSSEHLAAPATITLDQRGEYNRGRTEWRSGGGCAGGWALPGGWASPGGSGGVPAGASQPPAGAAPAPPDRPHPVSPSRASPCCAWWTKG